MNENKNKGCRRWFLVAILLLLPIAMLPIAIMITLLALPAIDAYREARSRIESELETCNACKGSGKNHLGVQCSTCNGRGRVLASTPCRVCGGSGEGFSLRGYAPPCSECRGTGKRNPPPPEP